MYTYVTYIYIYRYICVCIIYIYIYIYIYIERERGPARTAPAGRPPGAAAEAARLAQNALTYV